VERSIATMLVVHRSTIQASVDALMQAYVRLQQQLALIPATARAHPAPTPAAYQRESAVRARVDRLRSISLPLAKLVAYRHHHVDFFHGNFFTNGVTNVAT
jgi:hypothetical protein